MSIQRIKILAALLLITLIIAGCDNQKNVKILLVTGGHEYDRENFLEMIESLEGISFDEAIHPDANRLYASDSIDQYDVLVFYDLYQDITDEQKLAFLKMLEKGKGIVFLHHSIASYQDWEEFSEIRGGRYDLDTSTYADGQDVQVQIVNAKHPITKGLVDFFLHEETYAKYEVLPFVKPILSSDHSTSEKIIGWTNVYTNSRIVYLQPGHDNNAFSSPAYRKLVQSSIYWSADY